MDRKAWRRVFSAWLLSCTAAFGAVGCLMSGMRLEGSIFWLIVGCAVMAFAFSFCFEKSRLTLVPFCAVALLIGLWWHEGTLRYSVEGMVYSISNLYDLGYGWGVVQWSDWHMLNPDATPALLLVALPVVISVSVTTVYGQMGLLGSGVAMVPLLLCVVLKDTAPSPVYVVILFFAVLLILLTENVRARAPEAADRLLRMMLLPMAVLMVVLLLICPKDGYNWQEGAQRLEDFVLRLLQEEEAPELFDKPEFQNGDQDKVVQLDRVGKREETDKLIMTVKGADREILYLRGCAYDHYDGTSWSSTPGWNSWSLFYNSESSQLKSVTIRTEDVHSVLYFTYAPFDTERRVVGGRMRNDEQLQSYTMRYRDPIPYSDSLDEKNDDLGGEQLTEYLQLPESTRQTAENILRTRVGIPTQTGNAGQTWRNAQIIAQWVRGRGKYNLNAPKMPINQDDFALWFIEKSKVGYCTHFATATTVLLRAAGIPAQYVTGYLADLRGGGEAKVTQKQAHAWVEVFINGVGWVVLDPTPGYGADMQLELPEDPTASTEPEQSRPTRPIGELDQTEPTETETHAHTHPGEETRPGEETTPQTVPETGAQPSQGGGIGGGEGGGGSTNEALLPLLLTLLAVAMVLLAVIVQWRVRVSAKYGRLNRGKPNRCALMRYRAIAQMSRLLKLQPSEAAQQVAEKAAFSQHTISREELKLLGTEIAQLQTQLKKRNFLLQIVYTLVLALY